jgi:DNA-binding winged helix-turn-helix (wHTH) protein/TolB-like protein
VIYRFGLFEFDPAAGELRKQGRLVRLEPQPSRALALLVASAGEVITRDQLREHLWSDSTHVDYDRGLAYCLGQVRAALGDSADNPRFVETLPRRGFRFIAPVRTDPNGKGADPPPDPAVAISPIAPADAAPAAPAAPVSESVPHRRPGKWSSVALLAAAAVAGVAWAAWARLTPERPVVAVAVFDNETGRSEFDRLASTAADIMVERLTALGSDRVGIIGNTPSLRVPRTGRNPATVRAETGAGYFVFGQVQDDDAGVRLVVHLIRLDDDTHLWVTRIARAEADLSDIQDVAADRLAEAVRRHVVERDPNAPRFTR